MKFDDILRELSERVLVMGILNVTPDSFSDGGKFIDKDKAVEQALQMIEQGADIIDVGGESTRPGAPAVSVEQEIERVVPVIEAICSKTDVAVSVDTSKSEVAREAVKAGACIVNDVSGLRNDNGIAEPVAEADTGLVLMHSRGTSETMQSLTDYDNLIEDIKNELKVSIDVALSSGAKQRQIIIDPGIGFAKTAEQNYEIIARLSAIADLGYPMLLGPSRKSFIGNILNKPANERVWGTAAAVTACVLGGAKILRVHDVPEMTDVIRIAETIRKSTPT